VDLMPIFSTLRRHKVAALLIVLEIALAFAIVANALHLIGLRLATLSRDSGLAETELLVLMAGGVQGTDPDELTTRDLLTLRALPGVKSAAIVSQYVYGNNSNNSTARLEPGRNDGVRVQAANYFVGEDGLRTMGLTLLQGRDFRAEETVLDSWLSNQDDGQVGQVIISQAMAQKLFPAGSALGQPIYVMGDSPSVVVGVVQQMTHTRPGRAKNDELAMMFPVKPNHRGGVYLLRTEAGQRATVLQQASAALEKVDPRRILLKSATLEQERRRYYEEDRAMAWLMAGVCVALLVVTALGIVGLVSFWVQQRTRMIGTRRALGATRAQIRRYFQLENLLLAGAGIVLGVLGALAISAVLMQHYELPRLPLPYLLLGAPLLALLGQLAVLVPARRAAALSPVAALRA
jgi:putative ABC transport system permease protein